MMWTGIYELIKCDRLVDDMDVEKNGYELRVH